MTQDERKEIEHIAELETRRYFDHYLKDVWPTQAKALREHTHLMIEAHDANEKAHGGIKIKLNKLLILLAAAGASGGAAGKLLALLG